MEDIVARVGREAAAAAAGQPPVEQERGGLYNTKDEEQMAALQEWRREMEASWQAFVFSGSFGGWVGSFGGCSKSEEQMAALQDWWHEMEASGFWVPLFDATHHACLPAAQPPAIRLPAAAADKCLCRCHSINKLLNQSSFPLFHSVVLQKQMAEGDPQAQAEQMLKMSTAKIRKARCVSANRCPCSSTSTAWDLFT